MIIRKLIQIIFMAVLLVPIYSCGIAKTQVTSTPAPTITPTTMEDFSSIFPTALPPGKPVIDVTLQIKNMPDNGVGLGGYWANLTFNTYAKFWALGNGKYECYEYDNGNFITFGGLSPGLTGTVAAGIQGRYIVKSIGIITGMLLSSPMKPTSGFIGSFDAKGDEKGNTPGFMDNPMDWYFKPGWSETDFPLYEVDYSTCGNGSFGWILGKEGMPVVNGDIVGEQTECLNG
ncbi:MAG: hypothetical protein ABSC49_02845 [Candidatus Microgenomates bacterium]|jgi:hypothetical protein